jgi:outer membrane protein assembly factor BamB
MYCRGSGRQGWRNACARGLEALAATLVCALAASGALAGDWPQILGPKRNATAEGEQLAAWPAAGPELAWQYPVGDGFSGVAIAGGRVILFHRLGNELVAESLDLQTGRGQWKTVVAETNYRSSIAPDDGPRAVPAIASGRVFLFGPTGELACLDVESGKQVWFRQAYQEFNAPEGYFGAGSSPIVEDGKLLLNVGGRDGAGIVAFAVADGKTVWKATDEAASYSSPVAATIGGVRHVIFAARLNVVSLDPKNGAVRFEFPFGKRGPTAIGANPVVAGEHLFVTASYGAGARWVKVGAQGASELWESDEVMSSQYTTPVIHQGTLYGLDGRQDLGVARLRALDPATRKIHWTEEQFGTGNFVLAGDKLLVMKTDGELVLVGLSPRSYRPLARARLFETTVQALPALSGGLLLARDTKTLKCVRVGK